MTDLLRVLVPAETVNDESVRIVSLPVPNGHPVQKDQLIAEVETSKALLEIDAPEDGYLWLRCAVGEDVPVGSLLCVISKGREEPQMPGGEELGRSSSTDQAECNTVDPRGEQTTPAQNGKPAGRLRLVSQVSPPSERELGNLPPARFTPAAQRTAQQFGVDSSSFQRGTLVRSRDVRESVAHLASWLGVNSESQPSQPLRSEKLSRRKVAEARVLAEGQAVSLTAHVTVRCPVSEFQARLAIHNMGGSASAVVVFETAKLLRQYPVFNAVYLDEQSIGFYEHVNIGWAVNDGQGGLMVPVISLADSKSIGEIEAEMQRLLAAYVKDKLSVSDLRGATFTISDLSHEGASVFAPLISGGQSSILGVTTESLTLAFDHQLADGRTATRFLNDLKDRIVASLRAAGDDVGTGNQQPSCSFCGLETSELKKRKAILVPCEFPKRGWVCSVCLTGF
jgi:pyruvate/2-oxoglutarate dehydrogenase complex dihydrolipoamide acyltransferase (E2) component